MSVETFLDGRVTLHGGDVPDRRSAADLRGTMFEPLQDAAE